MDRVFYALYRDSKAKKEDIDVFLHYRIAFLQITKDKEVVDKSSRQKNHSYHLHNLSEEHDKVFKLKGERGDYINICTELNGYILLLTSLGYVFVCAESPVKGTKEFKKFKIRIKTKKIISSDFFTDPWDSSMSIIFSGEVGLKFISWKNENDRKNSKFETLLKKSNFSIGKEVDQNNLNEKLFTFVFSDGGQNAKNFIFAFKV